MTSDMYRHLRLFDAFIGVSQWRVHDNASKYPSLRGTKQSRIQRIMLRCSYQPCHLRLFDAFIGVSQWRSAENWLRSCWKL